MSTYSLQMGDNLYWSIVDLLENDVLFSQFLKQWRLPTSSIMHAHKIFFVKGDENMFVELEKCLQRKLPRNGWTVCGCSNEYYLWRYRQIPEYIFELIPEAIEKNRLRFVFFDMLMPIYLSAIIEGKGLCLHAACIKNRERAFLLVGDSGIGKTTCCSRLPLDWQVLTDEEVVLVKDYSDRWIVFPIPNITNFLQSGNIRNYLRFYGVPLEGVCFLRQGEQDCLQDIRTTESAQRLCKSALSVMARYTKFLNSIRVLNISIFENACRIARNSFCFELTVSLRGYFWELLESCSV